MKTKEELNELKEEVETVSKKLNELSEEELAQVSGGNLFHDFADLIYDKFQAIFGFGGKP